MALKPRNRAADLTVYVGVRLVVAVVQALPPRLAYALADGLAWLAYTVFGRRRRVALENVRRAFPELAADPAAADRLVRATFRHFTRAAMELMLTPRKLRAHTWRRYVAFPASSPLRPLLLGDRPVLIATAHVGNWEVAGITFGLLGYHTHAIARPLNNPHLERFADRLRRTHGQELIGKNGEFDRLAEVLGAGGKVAVLADQDAGERGAFVDFFGRPASTHKALALLALKYDAVVIVGGVLRADRADHPEDPTRNPADGLGPLFYSLEGEDVIDPREYAGVPRAAAVRGITERYMAAVERMARRHPEQYLWLHRRWKSRPTEERAGRAA